MNGEKNRNKVTVINDLYFGSKKLFCSLKKKLKGKGIFFFLMNGEKRGNK